jgi:hypothetical protein
MMAVAITDFVSLSGDYCGEFGYPFNIWGRTADLMMPH